MAHKFAGVWRSFIMVEDDWEPHGKMDLRTMTIGGQLNQGDHEHPAGTHRPIAGHAIIFGPFQSLNLEEGGDNYEGNVVFESAKRIVIAGKKHFGGRRESPERQDLLDQDDPPWIITKP